MAKAQRSLGRIESKLDEQVMGSCAHAGPEVMNLRVLCGEGC